MRILILILLFLSSLAHGMDIKFQKRAKDGNSVLTLTGSVELFQRFPNLIFKNKTRIVITSPGGNPNGVRPLMDWFIREIQELGGQPEVIVRDQCASSCLGILSTLNYLARSGAIRLILDRNLILGFHGCANLGQGKYSKSCTKEMVKYQLIHGVSHEWMMDNIELYARPNLEYIVNVSVTDPRLKGSRLINYGVLRKNTRTLTNP